MKTHALAIVILNWNNARDTLQCVESLLNSESEIKSTIFITDNGSEDDSISRIILWLNEKKVSFSHYNVKKSSWLCRVSNDNPAPVCIVENGENYGFAKGNNIALRFALQEYPVDFDKYFLLNNDTIVPKRSLDSLIETADKYHDFKAWTPVICYESEQDKVWNAGGFLTWWGERKYIGHKKSRHLLPVKGIRKITFITGCALLLDKCFLEKGIYLNEDFFFGEEDYYFSKQMKQLNVKIGVAFESTIYHKVGTSVTKVSPESQLPLLFIHHLNRIVDMRKWLSPVAFALWKPAFVLYAAFIVWWKRWYSFSSLRKFMGNLWRLSWKKQVKKEDFFNAHKIFNL